MSKIFGQHLVHFNHFSSHYHYEPHRQEQKKIGQNGCEQSDALLLCSTLCDPEAIKWLCPNFYIKTYCCNGAPCKIVDTKGSTRN